MTLHPDAAAGALAGAAGAILILLTRQGNLLGALAGLGVALLVSAGFGIAGLLPLAVFVLGSGLLTRIGRGRKERAGAAEPNQGRRDVRHVAAKLSLPALLGALALLGIAPARSLALAYTASLAGAFADTAATEVGPLTGGRAFGVRGFRLVPLPHGVSGGMSGGGIFAAAAAALLVAFGSLGVHLLDSAPQAWIAAAAGFLASLVESLLAGTAWGTRMGHFGRNVVLSLMSAGLALSARAIGWAAP